MLRVDHYGSGNFGYKVVWKNGIVAYSWFKTEKQRDDAFAQSKIKDGKRQETIDKVTR